MWEQVQCRLVRVGSRLLGAAAKHGEALAVWHSVGIPSKRIIGVGFLAFDLGPQFLGLSHLYWTYWTMTNGFQPVPIWAHPSSICGARRGPSAVGEFCRSSRRRQSWTCLAPDALRPREMFFPPWSWDSVLSNQGQWETQTAILYIYIFDDTWGEFCTLLVGRRVAAVVLLCDRGPRLWDFRYNCEMTPYFAPLST